MANRKPKIYFSDKTYEIPEYQKNGFLLYASEADSLDDAELCFYEEYPPERRYTRSTGYFGCTQVRSNHISVRYIRMKNGNAMYYGEQPFNLYETLNTADFDDERYHHDCITVLDNHISTIKVFQRAKKPVLYFGDSIIKISDQFLFSINKHLCWGGFVQSLSFRSYNSIKITFRDNTNMKEHILGDDGFSGLSDEFSTEDRSIKLHRVGESFFLSVTLPRELNHGQVSISEVQRNVDVARSIPITQSVEATYEKEFTTLRDILSEYYNLGIDFNIQEEIEKYAVAPDFIEPSATFLSSNLIKRPSFIQKTLNDNIWFTFHIGASYDKKFYCAARLADFAVDVQKNEAGSVYYVTFDGTQIEEMELMYYNLASPFNSHKDYMEEIYSYLKDNSFFTHLTDAISCYISDLREAYGYSSVVTNSVLVTIIKCIKKNKRAKLNELYTEMVRDNRANVRWSSEYKLFELVRKFYGDVVFQYRSMWLGHQSLDIYIPSLKIAIEYQGLQHYEAVEAFGGENALERTIARDYKKRQLCTEHGITVLYWKYNVHIDTNSLTSLLGEFGVDITTDNLTSSTVEGVDVPIDMAPAHVKAKSDKKPKPSSYIIKQYSTNGIFITDYLSYGEASQAAGVSKQQISNATRGCAKTAGGYLRRRVDRNDSTDDKSPIESVMQNESCNTAKSVLQVSLDGDIVAEYESINKASKASGVSCKSIRCALNGAQRTAGGYLWRKADYSNSFYGEEPLELLEKGKVSANEKSVQQLPFEGDKLAIYESIKTSSKESVVRRRNTTHIMNGTQNTAGGFRQIKEKQLIDMDIIASIIQNNNEQCGESDL